MKELKLVCKKSQRILLNISGTQFETYEHTLKRFPDTLLGNDRKRDAYFQKSEYFFDRNRLVFESILYFYQSFGRLKRPSDVPMDVFERECRYFELPEEAIEFMKKKEVLMVSESRYALLDNSFKGKIWKALQYPDSSHLALFFSLFSITLTCLSVAIALAETNSTVKKGMKQVEKQWIMLDFIITIWFSFEITLYVMCAPTFREAIRRPMTYIDFLSSYPYLFILIFSGNINIAILKFLRTMRLIKLLRFFKIFASTKSANMLGRIMYSSLPELFLLFLCLMMVIFLGASFIFMMESGTSNSKFTSIPECTWWALQTVVVLGYGDLIPTTNGGKLLAAVFMIFGATTLALPVLSVATKFLTIYEANGGI